MLLYLTNRNNVLKSCKEHGLFYLELFHLPEEETGAPLAVVEQDVHSRDALHSATSRLVFYSLHHCLAEAALCKLWQKLL